MARLTKAKSKLVRRFGVNIFGNAKYDRILKRRPTSPGEPRKSRPRQTEFARQLIEKQKLKFSYGISEGQLRRVFNFAKTQPGVTGDNMLFALESRLDNVIYRLGMASSRSQARQLVSHGHFLFNGRRVNVPSIKVRVGDKVQVRSKKSSVDMLRRLIAENGNCTVPAWLERGDVSGEVVMKITRDMIPTIAEEQQIVEFFSK